MATDIDWNFRSAVSYLSRRIVEADERVYKASSAMSGISAGGGLTPFLADHRSALERLHKLQDELIVLCKKGKVE